jgi:hypothetical protein
MKRRCAFVMGSMTAVFVLGAITTPSRAQSYTPLTVILQECVYDRAGEMRAKQVLILAVRGDGAVIEERISDHNGPLARTRSIHNRESATKTVLDFATQSKTSYYGMRLRDFKERLLSDYSAMADEGELILGERVIKVTHQSRRSRVDTWLAPGLDYVPLRGEFVAFGDDGEIAARTVKEAVEILRGEPDPSLFSIPDNFIERSPSEVYAEIEKLRNGKCPGCGDKALRDALLDGVYRRFRSP